MKQTKTKILLLLFAVVTVMAAAAEYQYTPLVREGVVWEYLYNNVDIDDPNDHYETYKLQFAGTEVIDGIEYHKLYRYTTALNIGDEPVAYMRETADGIVLCRYNSTLSDVLLYDFGNVTEFYKTEYVRWNGLDVTFMDEVEYAGYSHKRYNISQLTGTHLIEGVGFDNGDSNVYAPLTSLVPDCICPYTVGLIGLYDIDGNLIYRSDKYNEYEQLLSGINDVYIDNNDDAVVVYDLLGRRVRHIERGVPHIAGGRVVVK